MWSLLLFISVPGAGTVSTTASTHYFEWTCKRQAEKLKEKLYKPGVEYTLRCVKR